MALRVDRPESTSRVLTVPNVITFVRLACLPVYLWLLFGLEDRLAAAVLLALLGITDFVDGYIARHFHQVSDLGTVLDPVADRLLFIVGVGGIMIDGAAPQWFSLLVLVREVLVGGAMLVLTLMGMKRFGVSWWGKAGTLALMVSFPAFLASEAAFRLADAMRLLGWVSGIPGLIISYYAAITYIPVMRRNLAEGRAERRAPLPLP
ncbi:MAG TPA: CDP-alcohol phosphatidyltransferase family protein [Acidimicrobiales bacterium]|nr:CDP-alcohol phosphatidyltransferase family protein [Acidimicrobiales bacterium]